MLYICLNNQLFMLNAYLISLCRRHRRRTLLSFLDFFSLSHFHISPFGSQKSSLFMLQLLFATCNAAAAVYSSNEDDEWGVGMNFEHIRASHPPQKVHIVMESLLIS